MSAAYALFLSPHAGEPPRWWRLAGDTIVAGAGWPTPADDDRLIAVPPLATVTLHWGELPDRSPAQTLAAARILADQAIASGAATHVAVAASPDADGLRPIAVTAPEAIASWIADLERAGLNDTPIVPAALLLPLPPAAGFVRATLPFGALVRGPGTAFADEPGLTELVVGTEPLAELEQAALGPTLAAAIAAPPLDLRQGAFARVRRRAIDWSLVRRLAVLLGLVLLATLAIDLVQLARYSFGASTLEARADAAARTGLPRGAGEGDAARMLEARLARLRGPGLGFSRSAAAAFAVVRQVDGARVTALAFQPTGALRLSLDVPTEGGANTIKGKLEAAGFAVQASTFVASGGRLTGDLTLVAP